MGRSLRDHKLETRNARLRLPRSKNGYWRGLTIGCHVGYFRRSQGGIWVVRRHRSGTTKYYQHKLGAADDVLDADGTKVLDFQQAQAKAREWLDVMGFGSSGRQDLYTVGDALDDYVNSFTGKSLDKTVHTLERYIRPRFGKRPVCELTTAELRQFQAELALRKSVYRPNRKGVAKERPQDHDSMRRAKANANRILTPLKAALNRAFSDGRVPDDRAWRRVKPFSKVSAARIRYFTPAEVNALLTAADPWFRSVLQGALFTGARWSEIHQMRARDVDLQTGTILFPETKGGRPRHVHLTDDGLRFFVRQCAGKAMSDHVFLNQHGRVMRLSHQIRPMRETCERAKVEPAGFHILRHTYGSTLAMAGVPLAVIAEALGHADERITRKHYAHLCPSYVRDAVRTGLGSLGVFAAPRPRLIGAD